MLVFTSIEDDEAVFAAMRAGIRGYILKDAEREDIIRAIRGVAATLAATLVAYDTLNPAGQRLIDGATLNVVLVLMLTTSILGPVLPERFAPRMLPDLRPAKAA